MLTRFTIREILEKAIQKEIEAQHLYGDLSRKMTDTAARDALLGLRREEQGHQRLLEQYRRGELKEGALNSKQTVDYQIAERLDQPAISPDMPLKDTFLLAANREKVSHEFYLSLAQIHPVGAVRRLIEGLATQELAHKQRVELLYTEVAFPQTDGG